MSTPVNASISFQTPSLLTPEQLKSSTIQDFKSPFLRPDQLAIDHVKVLQPPPAPPAPVSVDVHGGEKGAVSGNISYTPGDFASMQAAAEELMKNGNEEDYLAGQKLMYKAYQILQTESLLESLRQKLFNDINDALQSAAG